jgi:hypothetical protein
MNLSELPIRGFPNIRPLPRMEGRDAAGGGGHHFSTCNLKGRCHENPYVGSCHGTSHGCTKVSKALKDLGHNARICGLVLDPPAIHIILQ